MAQHKPASTEDPTSQDDRSGSPKPAVAPSKPGTPLQTVAEEPTPFGPIRRHGLREATELEPRPAAPKTPDLPAGVELQADGSPRPPERHRSAWSRLNVFWDRQISLVVPHEDCRDHFANERTYLAYLRTSGALASLGIVVAQLFRLQGRLDPSHAATDAFFALAIPVAGVCIGLAVVVALAGAFRFWRQQNAMARGKCHAGGWEPCAVAVVLVLTLILVFVVLLVVTVEG